MSIRFKKQEILDFIKAKGEAVSCIGLEVLDKIEEVGVGSASDRLSIPMLSFVGMTARSPETLLKSSDAIILFVDDSIDISGIDGKCIVQCSSARLVFCEFLSLVHTPQGIWSNKGTFVHETAHLGDDVIIGNNCSIGDNVVIGNGCRIFDNVTIMNDVVIGNRVSIYPGSVIGMDGFGYELRDDGAYQKFPHIGDVRIGDDVEIGANTVIDRGSLASTKIGDGVKIDNLVHISHNVVIGDNSLIIANAMVAGGVEIGSGSWIGPSSNIVDRTRVGNNVFVGMGVSIIKNLADGERYTIKNLFKTFMSN